MKSMTGFGRADCEEFGWKCNVEIRSVNHRYGEIAFRMPKSFNILEEKMRSLVLQHVKRGRIEVSIVLEKQGFESRSVQLDKDLAMSYYSALKEMSEMLGLPFQADVYEISKYPEVLQIQESSSSLENAEKIILKTLDQAVAELLQMRCNEGTHICQDLIQRLESLHALLECILERAPQVIAEYKKKYIYHIREFLADSHVEIDEIRLLQEIAAFAEKVNFTEETVRLQSHFSQFRKILQEDGPVGRKLDFLIQEFHREVNTIASKANDACIANLIVSMKSEIEKIREQIQNVE